MAKGVLGNDPFQRGAASREGAPAKPGPHQKERSPSERGSSDSKKSSSSRAAASAQKASPARGAKASASGRASTSAKKPPRGKPAPEKTAKEAGRASAKGAQGSRGGAPGRPGKQRPASGSAPFAKTAATQGLDTNNEVEPLREPAAPEAPREPPPAREPVVTEKSTGRTARQRDVDHALAEALAAEVAEITAKHAVDQAMDRRAGEDEPVDRLLATEMATELAEAAVEEVLEHSPSSRRPERERELATTVAAQVAESAAELAVAEVMDRRVTGSERLDERAADNHVDELDEEERFDVELREDARMSGAVLETYEYDNTQDGDEDAWTRSAEPHAVDSASVEPEVEMPDATRDESPHGRRGPLSLVQTSGDSGPEPSVEPFRESDAPRPLAERASGMFSLAREIAGQALASEGLGRAWGAVHGMLDAVRAGLGTGGGAHLDEYGKDPSLVQRLEPVLEFLYGQYWRVSAQGADHIPGGAVILVANHSGALPYDGLVMSLALARERPDLREPRWLVEDQIFHAPVLGTLFNRLGAVRACPENALRLLDEQRPLVVFPEGYQGLSKPFAERYRLKRFGRGGFVKLALRTGAPIVPVAIVGAEETSPMLGRLPASFLGLPYVPLTPLGPLPLPAKWSIRFGEPISMDGLPSEAADDLGEVGRLTERTREAIQGMLHSLLRQRRSIFAG
ncbi:lysophospholipid acyltransferase family protein [Myxococcus stipitatus]|uniref:lysophospholipid acyltransferase family protein n=1 Tax=Myxococcus stipitatus TaxID=83455 RepID=UPI0030CCC018